LRALDGTDAGDAANAENHAVEVVQVLSFGDKLDDGFAVFSVVDFNAADVGVVFGDDGGRRKP
jgi:hypothetical protein